MESVNYKKSGMVFDTQRFSVNDGPGIRTIIFLKGCPLKCAWCSNPESQRMNPELMYRSIACIGCLRCVEVCKYDAIGPKYERWVNRKKCVNCGECAVACPSGALLMKGRVMTVEEVIKEAKKDDSYYWNSGGGITLSGGEALMQPEFAKEIFKAAHAQGWNTAIETEGYAREEVIRDVIPHVDTVLLDIKANDTDIHKKWTAVDNHLIKENAKIIQELAHTIIRVPTIPGVNADKKEFTDIVKFVAGLGKVKELHILPYHRFGENKYNLLGKDYDLEGVQTLDEEYVEELKKIVEDHGLICKIGG